MTRLTVTRSEEQDKRLRERAESCRQPISEVVRSILDDAISEWDRRRAEPPPFLGLIDVEMPFTAAESEEELARIVAET
jgi:hypothetical protein